MPPLFLEVIHASVISALRGSGCAQDTVVARVRCVNSPQADETRTFATTTGALIELQKWLSAHALTHVAMEATGV